MSQNTQKRTLSKVELKRLIEDFIDDAQTDSPALLQLQSIASGRMVPYTRGAKKPVLREVETEMLVGDKMNPYWLLDMREAYTRYNADHMRYYGVAWSLYSHQMKEIDAMARAHGIDFKSLTGEGAEITADVIGKNTKELQAILRGVRQSTRMGLTMLDEAKKKSLERLVRLAIRVNRLCRRKSPKTALGRRQEVYEALHGLRYMLYVMRSNVMSGDRLEVMMVPPHLVMMFLVIGLARKYAQKHRIQGVVIQIAPGHGKTQAIIADRALQINLNPGDAYGFLHYSDDYARDRYESVKRHFLDSTPEGKRRRALFPNITIDTGERTDYKLRVNDGGERVCPFEEGNLTYYGVHTAAEGVSAIELSIDDPSKAKEMIEEGSRNATTAAMMRTWMPRLRGVRSFFVLICTQWHPEDFAAKLVEMGRKGEINIGWYAQPVGGPEDDFKSIWEEVVPSWKLRTAYYRDPDAYPCLYQQRGANERMRSVARLHYYDFRQWERFDDREPQWARFFEAADTEYWVSCDPSGVVRKRSNYAGAILWAFGRLGVPNEAGIVVDQPKLVAVRKYSNRAGQALLAEQLIALRDGLMAPPMRREIDRWVIEATGGYHATPEFMEEMHGIEPSRITRRPPGMANKTAKFLKVSRHVEIGDVLFPGSWFTDPDTGEEKLGPHPDWEDVPQQLLQAGLTLQTNLLDCVRLILEELGPQILRMSLPNDGSGGGYDSAPGDRRARFHHDTLARLREERRIRDEEMEQEEPGMMLIFGE